MNQNKDWMRWAALEGLTKTISKGLSKLIGVTAMSLSGITISTLVIGIFQAAGGLLGSKLKKQTLLVTRGQLLGAIVFGIMATAMSIIVKYVFTYPDADIGISTFLITMSIIPGALVDWIIYKDRLNGRQWLGIGFFLAAGYAILGFPSLTELLHLPTWVWLSLLLAVLLVVNETITRYVRKMNPFPYNFWIGVTTIVATVITLFVIDDWNIALRMPVVFWLAAMLIGINVLAMISFKLMSYKDGGTIALKKLVTKSIYLTGATLVGIIFFDEPLTIGKIVGITGFLIAFSLTDNETWEMIKARLGHKK